MRSPSRAGTPTSQFDADPVGHRRRTDRRHQRRTHDRAGTAPGPSLTEHQVDVGADVRGQVDLVDHEQVGERHAGATLAGDVIAASGVDDEYLDIDEPAAEDRCQVVATRFDEA